MLNTILPSRANPTHRAKRKALEQEHSFDNLKSMGLKAGVLALVAGLALYPKISAEADVVEREMRMKRERKDIFKRERGGRREEGYDRRDGGGREDRGKMSFDEYGYAGSREERDGWRRREDRGGYGERERGAYVERERGEYREREREGYGERERGDYVESGRGGDSRRDGGKVMRLDEYNVRTREGYRERDRPREQGSARSSGSSRTQQWVEGGYEYLNANDYQERDRRRW